MRKILAILTLCCLPAWADFTSTQEAFGPLKLGTTASELQKKLGAPQSKSKPVFEAATGVTVETWRYPSKGFEVVLGHVDKKDPLKIDRMTITKPCVWKTRRGIGIGDTASRVRSVYAKEIRPEVNSPDSIVVGTVYDGLIMHIKNGKVDTLFLGAAAE